MYPHLQDRPRPSAVHGVLASRFSISRFSVSRFALLCLLLLAIAGPGFSQATTALSAPTNLTATAEDGSVSLVWDAVTGSDNYQLYRSTTSGGPYTYIANLAGSTTTFVDGNSSYPLSNGNYYYVIRAVNSSNTSDYSAEASATLAIAAPSALTATAGDGSVSLSWSAVSGADYYQLYRSSSPGGPYTYIAYLGGTTTALADGNSSYPLANGPYYYVVRAGDNGGVSSYSSEASVTLSIAAPTNLTATAGDGSISLAWNEASGADSYRLYRATTAGGPYTYIAYLGGSTTTFTDGNSSYPLANGTYYYVLRSGNNGGFSDYSSEASATLAVATPAGLTATAGDGSVSLSWSALAGADYYRLYRASTSGGPYTYIAYLSGSTTTFMDGNSSYPLPNGTYYYVLLAGNNGGQGAYSNEASVTLSIAAPTSLTATPGDGSVSLSWTAAAGADYYQLSRSTTAGGPYTYIAYLGGSTTAFTDGNSSYPLPNNTYYYVLKAGNAGGVSSYSNEASTALTIPAPANLTATAGDGAVLLSWNSVTGADYYQVFRASTSGGGYTYIAGLNSSTTAFTDGNSSYPLANGTYYYVVKAGNAGGQSAYSNEASAILGVAAPTNLTATPGDGSVALSWQPAVGAGYYQLYRSMTSGGPYTYIAGLNSTATTFTDNNNGYNLQNGTYYYVVKAGNSGGQSAYSNEASAMLSASPPLNLTATPGDGSVTLTWQSGSADYYQLCRSTTPGGPYSVIGNFNSSTTSFVDTGGYYGLQNGTYYYVLRAGNAGGISGNSAEVSATLSVGTPTGLTASPGDGSVSLSWQPASGADYYQLYRSTTSGGPYTFVGGFSSGTTSCVDHGGYYGLQNGTYYYVLLAGNNGGQSSYSNEASVTLAVAAPTNLTAIPGDGLVNLAWNAVMGADYYQVFRASVSGGPYTFIGGLGSTTTSFVDRGGYYGLQNGTYYYVVLAGNNGGQSAYSNEASVALSVVAPNGLTASPGDGIVNLSWNAVSGADYYQLYRATTSGGPYTFIGGLGSTTTSFVDHGGYYGLQNGTYYYVLLAGNNGGQSSYSNEAAVTLSIAAPANLTATLAPNGVSLAWNAVSNADYYQVFRASVSGGPYTYVGGSGPSTTRFVDTGGYYGLQDGTYYYVVLAGNNGGQSAYSNEVSLTVIPIVIGLTFNPSPVLGGNSATGTVYMNGVSQADCVINLAGDSSAATLPATVTVPAGRTSATFPLNTAAVTAITPDDVTATYAGLTTQATLSIVPLLSSVTLNPNPVAGGNSATGYISLNGPAPDGGAIVSLSSDNLIALVPTSITVPAGYSSASFAVKTVPVTAPATANIGASYGSTTITTALTVNPLSLVSLSLNPNPVTGGNDVSGTVALNGTAPDGGVVVNLVSDSASAAVPTSVTIPAGYSSASFTLSTSVVAIGTVANISASYNGVTQEAALSINTAAFHDFTISPTQVAGGSTTTGTITLTGPALAGGDIIALTSDNPAASVPASVIVVAGKNSVSFPIGTTNVITATVANITSSYAGMNMTAGLTVLPPFTLTANAANVNASISGGTSGSSTSSTLTTTAGALTSTPIPITLSLGTLPPGVTGWLSAGTAVVPPATPHNVNSSTNGLTAVTLYLVAGPNASPGSYPITVTAAQEGYSVSTIVTLTVAP